MAEQKAKARAAWAGSGEAADARVWYDIAEEKGTTEFLGYDTEKAEGQIQALVTDGARIDAAEKGAAVQIVVNQTPFYAEAGGQVGDTGFIRTDSGEAKVTDTKQVAGVFLHIAEVVKGKIETGQGAELVVDHLRRTAIRANHSATHLLNEALRQELGEHVAQRGSLNAPDRLRFDFSHSKALSPQEIANIEREVNTYIRQNSAVETRVMPIDEARNQGAQALFGEKYGDEVRVVSMGVAPTGKGTGGQTYSIELCGGTHVSRTGDIGVFKIVSEGASAAGIRRIEAITGKDVIDDVQTTYAVLGEIGQALHAQPDEMGARVRQLQSERKALQAEVAQLRRELAMSGGAKQAATPKEIGGVPFLAQVLSGVSGKDLPPLIDEHKAALGSGAVLLIADTGGKAAVAAGVTGDLTERLSAVDMVRAAVAELGGKGGGGRPDMAQGGGKDASNAKAAVAAVETLIGG